MTLSSYARGQNLDAALVSFLAVLGDKPFSAFCISPSDYPSVLSTTWAELAHGGWLEEMFMNFEMYQLAPAGYVRALKMSGRSDEPQFREKLGRLCNVLKDSLKGRTDFALIPFQELVTESGVSKEFACNALDADLIGSILGRMGATWEGEHFVKVPSDFGLART